MAQDYPMKVCCVRICVPVQKAITGRNEFACMEDMEKIVEILKQIIYVYAQ